MAFFGRIFWGVLAAVTVLLTVNGCSPADSGQVDEEKEPHFVLGNSRFNEMDWTGAVEAFEQSLEVNPHSAQAHYRLAQLFEAKLPDPAAAIYHYQQYLKLAPDADNREVIAHRIDGCKQQLAAGVMSLPSSPGVQKQMDALIEQNRKLQSQVSDLTSNLNAWVAYAASLKNSQGANNAGGQTSAVSATPDDISPQADSTTATATPTTKARTAATTISAKKVVTPNPPSVRKHIVLSGETMAGIAKKAGVSLKALQAVNPGVNPKKIRAGQSLNLPP